MTILGIETSTAVCSVGLANEFGLAIGEINCRVAYSFRKIVNIDSRIV